MFDQNAINRLLSMIELKHEPVLVYNRNREKHSIKKIIARYNQQEITENDFMSQFLYHAISSNNFDLVKLLFHEYNFVITDEIIKKFPSEISYEMVILIGDIIGESIVNKLDHDVVYYLFFQAYNEGNKKRIQELIDAGFDCNKIDDKSDVLWGPDKIDFLFGLDKSSYNCLQIMIDNGFNLNFIDSDILIPVFRSYNYGIIKVLVANGVDINKITTSITDLPDNFNKIYALMEDLNFNPKIIAYLMSRQDQTNKLFDILSRPNQ